MKGSDPRVILKELLRKNLVGPCNDTFLDNNEEEIICDYPLNKYLAGIIFPHLEGLPESIGDEHQMEIDLSEDTTTELELAPDWDDESEKSDNLVEEGRLANDDFTRPELYPNSLGLSFCLDRAAQDTVIDISFGSYRQLDPTFEIHPMLRINMEFDDYDLIRSLNAGNQEYLENLISYDQDTKTVYLSRKLVGQSRKEVSGDFKNLETIRQAVYERLKSAKDLEKDRYTRIKNILESIHSLYRKTWIRRQHHFQYKITLSELETRKVICIPSERIDNSSISYNLHVLMIENKPEIRVIKLLLENRQNMKSQGNELRRSPMLNDICMFQCKIKVQNENLLPLPQPPLPSYATMEDKIMDCQYRDSKVYAQAHNCACSWHKVDGKIKVVQTEVLPSTIPPVSTNTYLENSRSALKVKDSSYYSSSTDSQIIQWLNLFVNGYESWIETQDKLALNLNTRYAEAAKTMLVNQRSALSRMREGVELLDNPEYLDIYRLTNSAMLINMIKNDPSSDPEPGEEAENIHYHAFQLAFLLINVECIIHPNSDTRSKSVDLLWFPTGGGKTEAYFLLSVFSLLLRRIKHGSAGYGTSVIMRYTLRLLTAQQFERAARMVLSLNFVCDKFMPQLIEEEPFSIGLWIGASSSPNKLRDANGSAEEIIDKISDAPDLTTAQRQNKFPITHCPWCGSSLVDKGKMGFKMGFNVLKNKFEVFCLDTECFFHRGLPIDLVDESLYNNPPSLLFATVDKFARLAWVEEASVFFGSTEGVLPPDLIIQDELHLISGPLGSITALFESVVEMLCRKGNKMPRIIASTATIKNAAAQVKGLFGNRDVFTFPPAGLNFGDNFFSKTLKHENTREYIGICPSGKTVTTTQVRLLALLLFGRQELANRIDEDLDCYWTVISYYNSLRELGRMYSKTRDEVQQAYKQMVLKRNPLSKRYLLRHPKELTSRISGYEVKQVLKSLELPSIVGNDPNKVQNNAIDVVFATNMISVGLDIPRLNLILMNGQPKSASEYIQVTSRIARNYPGLVLTLFNPFKARDKSHFENFASFHQNYYRFVEPISVTP
ncbi:MAG: helicase-related protein, partial [Candidatus Cloacimonetes bacterium]|nr:helicase-related protein [Candidatus Cloacimonadota bacterium]